MFERVLKSVIGGSLTYVISGYVLDELITGTTVADNIYTLIIPLCIGAATIMAIFGFGGNPQGGM